MNNMSFAICYDIDDEFEDGCKQSGMFYVVGHVHFHFLSHVSYPTFLPRKFKETLSNHRIAGFHRTQFSSRRVSDQVTYQYKWQPGFPVSTVKLPHLF